MQGLLRIETLRASHGAHSDLLAVVETNIVRELLDSFLCVLVARVNDPTESLLQYGRAKVTVRVPPVARAGRGAARA